MKIYIGADHGGYHLKEKVKDLLQEKGLQYLDLGNSFYDEEDDYPDFALPVAMRVAEDKDSLGVLACKSGVGVDIVANKIKGVRSCLGFSKEQIEKSKEDDNINVLCLPADYINEDEAIEFVETFLSSSFSDGEKYARRLEKIKKIEKEI